MNIKEEKDYLYNELKEISQTRFTGTIGGDIVILNKIVNRATEAIKEIDND